MITHVMPPAEINHAFELMKRGESIRSVVTVLGDPHRENDRTSHEAELRHCRCLHRTQFAGNPLGVVLNAQGLSDGQMQAIAAEFNLAETTFVLPPKDPRIPPR